MNIPKIRFKEFRNEWHSCKIDDFCKILMCKRIFANETSQDYEIPFYKIGTIGGTPDTFISKKLFDIYKIKYNYPKKGELLVTCSGTVGKCIIFDGKDSYYQDSNIVWLDNPTLKVSNRFLYYLLSRVDWSKLNSTTITRIYSNDLKQLKINYPEKEEQNKITNLLELLDKKIELQTKKIEALKLFKSYTKSEIFKNGNHVCKLGAILNKWNKKNKDGAINYVESISNKAGFIPQSEQFEDRNVASKNLRNYYVIKKGVFGYNPSRLNVGSLALKENDFISVVSPLYECFTTTQNNTYLFEWFNSNNFKKETFSKFEGGVRNTLNFNNLCDIPINLPDIETQNQYAKYFNKINFKISLEEQKLSELVKFKKGLLQDMFI